MEKAKKFCEATKVSFRKYAGEINDCDNFSFALMGYWSDGLKSSPFGIAWSKTHAFNFMVDDKKRLWIVEPQTNKWFSIDEAKNQPIYWPWRFALC